MLDLVDIFAAAPEAPPGANSWDMTRAGAQAQAAGPLRADPWDPLGKTFYAHPTMHFHTLLKNYNSVLSVC